MTYPTYANRCRQISTSTGNGDFTLGAALTTFQQFIPAVPSGSLVDYEITPRAGTEAHIANQWEVGTGVVVQAGDFVTLQRNTVQAGSSGTTKVDFLSGIKEVSLVLSAERISEIFTNNVDGPVDGVSTDGAVALWDGVTGRLLKNGQVPGTMYTQNASAVAITGGSITGIVDLAVADGGTGASTAAAARTNLGLGTMATQDASAVTITGGSITGITDLAVADGGTGASTASGARTNLGLGSIATQDASSVTITGGSVTGLSALSVVGNTTVGDANTDTLTINASMAATLQWLTDNVYDIGVPGPFVTDSGAFRPRSGYFGTRVSTPRMQAAEVAGVQLLSENGTQIGLFGASNTSASLFYGDVTVNGTLHFPSSVNVSASAGTLTVSGDLNVQGGDLVTSGSLGTVFNTPTTVTAFQAATSVSIGATTGTTTVRNALAVNGNATLGDSALDTTTINAQLAANATFTANGAVNLSPAGQNVTISPTSFGAVVIAPSGGSALQIAPVGTTGTMNNVAIGQTTPQSGAFTSLSASGGTLTLSPSTSGTINNVVIGAVTPLAGTFTTLTSTGNATLGDTSADSHTLNGTMTVQTAGEILLDDSITTAGAALPLAFDGDADTGLFRPAANTLAVATGAVERLRINSSGQAIFGAASSSIAGALLGSAGVLVGANNTSAPNASIRMAFANDTGALTHNLLISRSRGNLTTPTAVVNNDAIGGIQFQAYDGATLFSAAAIDAVVDNVVSTGVTPGRLTFRTMTSAGIFTERARIGSDGTISLGASPGAESFRVVPVAGSNRWPEASGSNAGNPSLIASAGSLQIGGSAILGGSGSTIGFYGTAAGAKPTITGSRGGNAALASLLTALATLGLITDSTTA